MKSFRLDIWTYRQTDDRYIYSLSRGFKLLSHIFNIPYFHPFSMRTGYEKMACTKAYLTNTRAINYEKRMLFGKQLPRSIPRNPSSPLSTLSIFPIHIPLRIPSALRCEMSKAIKYQFRVTTNAKNERKLMRPSVARGAKRTKRERNGVEHDKIYIDIKCTKKNKEEIIEKCIAVKMKQNTIC